MAKKIQYMGLSDSRTIASGDTVNGTVAGGLPVSITWNSANNWVIDTTQAPYTGITDVMAAALFALPHGEFVDVTSTPQTPTHTSTYGPTGVSGQLATTHTTSTGATPVITTGAGATAASVGGRGANDTAGTFSVTALASGNTADEILATVTFAQAYSSAPKGVDVEGENAAAEAAQLYATNITATSFQIAAHVAPTASAVMVGNYRVVG